jgi:hypothetical protein
MDQQLERRQSGEISGALSASSGFGSSGAVMRGETAATAIAAREQAAVQSRYIMAERNPRDIESFRVKLLQHAKRPGFASTAIYRKPVGNGQHAEGPSIRFCEAALQCYRNVYPEVSTVFDGPELRIVRVTVTDLEANLAYSSEIAIEKTVERKSAKGREVISERLNSYGETTYTLRATEDEIIIRQAALVSKAIRTNGLRLLPPDILEEAIKAIKATLQGEIKADPALAKRRIIDAFAEQGVSPQDLGVYLGHSLEQVTVKELEDLRSVHSSLKNGEATWAEIMDKADTTPDPDFAAAERARIKAEADALAAQRAAAKNAPGPTVETAVSEESAELTEEEMRRIESEQAKRGSDASAEPKPTSAPRGFKRI